MKINNAITFGSKNSPIAPLEIQTRQGPIWIEEIQKKDIIQIVNIITISTSYDHLLVKIEFF